MYLHVKTQVFDRIFKVLGELDSGEEINIAWWWGNISFISKNVELNFSCGDEYNKGDIWCGDIYDPQPVYIDTDKIEKPLTALKLNHLISYKMMKDAVEPITMNQGSWLKFLVGPKSITLECQYTDASV